MSDLVEDMQVVERQINERLQESVECIELVETELAAASAVLVTDEPKNTDQWDDQNQRGSTDNILGDIEESETNCLALLTSERRIKTYPFPHSDERPDKVVTLCTQKFPVLKVVATNRRKQTSLRKWPHKLARKKTTQANTRQLSVKGEEN